MTAAFSADYLTFQAIEHIACVWARQPSCHHGDCDRAEERASLANRITA